MSESDPAAARRQRQTRRWWQCRNLIWRPWLLLYAALVALHAPLLRLPYYWDEAGYFIFAGLDFFRHGWLIPHSTLANGHPPLLSISLSAAWWLAGFHPWVTRAAMCVWAAALVGGVGRLVALGPRTAAGEPLRRSSVQAGVAAAVLVGLCPLVFAQSTLALLDLPVAALVVWALVWRMRGRGWGAIACLCAAVLMKETAVIAAAALFVLDFGRGWREKREIRRACIVAAPMIVPAAVLGAWFLFYHHATGYWFGNPEYFAYNVGAAATSLPRIGLSLLRRLWQLAGYNGTWLLTLLAGWALWRRRVSAAPPPPDWLAIVVAYVLFHAVVGGAVLARYLLPALALYVAWTAEQILTLPRGRAWVGVAAAFLVACWFWNPPYPFPYEDNLAYASFVELHQAAARRLDLEAGSGPIWTAWPATDELTRPELGYVTHALPVHAIPDFGRRTLARVRQKPGRLYLYSQIYQPRRDWADEVPDWRRWAGRYYAYDPPAPASAWLGRWGLKQSFRASRGGQWVLLAEPALRRQSSAVSAPASAPPAAAAPDRR